MEFPPVPRFRAYLGASTRWLGPALIPHPARAAVTRARASMKQRFLTPFLCRQCANYECFTGLYVRETRYAIMPIFPTRDGSILLGRDGAPLNSQFHIGYGLLPALEYNHHHLRNRYM